VVVVVIILGVLVVALLVVLAMARSSVTAARSQVEVLTTRLEEATAEGEAAAADATEARARADQANVRADESAAERDALADELAESARTVDAAEKRADAAEAAASRGLDAMGTWALETLRLDRAWRDTVASSAVDQSPFATSTDPARSGVEILCAVLREGSGTPTDLTWDLATPLGPVPAATLVRTVEELLAFARAADSASLTVEAGEASVLVRLATEPDLALPPHLSAALEAAGLEVCIDDQVSAITTNVPSPPDTPDWSQG
jgi:hypothetical protein